jgi:hypothetical protein
MSQRFSNDRLARLRAQLQQLILMRETGPKRAAWHAARARLIWRLHDELRQAAEEIENADVEQPESADTPPRGQVATPSDD